MFLLNHLAMIVDGMNLDTLQTEQSQLWVSPTILRGAPPAGVDVKTAFNSFRPPPHKVQPFKATSNRLRAADLKSERAKYDRSQQGGPQPETYLHPSYIPRIVLRPVEETPYELQRHAHIISYPLMAFILDYIHGTIIQHDNVNGDLVVPDQDLFILDKLSEQARTRIKQWARSQWNVFIPFLGAQTIDVAFHNARTLLMGCGKWCWQKEWDNSVRTSSSEEGCE
jgi:hypothetical protein